MSGRWAGYADAVLARLFVRGHPAPSKKALHDAYPFGERAGQSRPSTLRATTARQIERADKNTGDLFGEETPR